MYRRVWLAVFALGGCGSATLVDGGWFDNYRSYNEYNAKLAEFAATYPSLVTPVDVGNSYEGRAIRGIRITGNGPAQVAKKAIVLDGLMHAREWIAGMVPMYVADQLLSGYGSDPRVTDIMDNVEFVIVPVTNPDGYEYSRTVNRQWRKNRRPVGGGAYGVDLNRNFGVGWGLNSGSSPSPGSQTYRGPAPFSEPESQALRDLMLETQHAVSYVNYHSYSQLILSPWGYTVDPAPDAALLQQLGDRMAASILGVHGQVYQAGPASAELYLASGVAIDWAYGDQGMYSYTIELRPQSSFPGFELPPAEIIPTSQEMWPAMLDLAEFTIQLAGGDFNDDGGYDCLDVDRLVNGIAYGTVRAELDLTGNGSVDTADLFDWLGRAGAARLGAGQAFLPGDANLDGLVDGTDFNMWNAHKFTAAAAWCRGDFNADGVVDGGDFNLWNMNKFSSAGQGQLVPEPVLALWLLLALGCRKRARS